MAVTQGIGPGAAAAACRCRLSLPLHGRTLHGGRPGNEIGGRWRTAPKSCNRSACSPWSRLVPRVNERENPSSPLIFSRFGSTGEPGKSC
jgi:hypothetical protein